MKLIDVLTINDNERIFKETKRDVIYKMKDNQLLYKTLPIENWDIVIAIDIDSLMTTEVEEYLKPKNPFERVKEGEVYYYITNCLKIEKTKDYHVSINNATFFSGNYFNDEETAKEALEQVRECLDKFKEHKLNELDIKE